jgi:osmotically-inducible protein OsmY
MKTNDQLQHDVQDAIKWEPLLSAAEIGVTAKDGVVTLSGVVDNYFKKTEAENAARKVAGVKAVAETITVNFGGRYKKNDTEIANEVLSVFKQMWEIPIDELKVEVENGYVTLGGNVQWNFQRLAAKQSIIHLAGVVGVENNIQVKSDTVDAVEKKDIECAFNRHWSMDDNEIHVEVAGNKVTLTGMVTSLYQKDEAEQIAWNAPGVRSMDNQLVVGHLN